MQAIYTGLLAGFIVGFISVAYVLIRTWYVNSRIEMNHLETTEIKIQSTDWMIMAIISSGSVLWGLIGAGIYHLLRDGVKLMIFSGIATVLIILYLSVAKIKNRFDKIVLSIIIVAGLGFLIPYLY